MLVVKLGGSLLDAQHARSWLTQLLTQSQPVVVVPGGGVFANTVRDLQPRWGFDDAAAHHMAVLAMAQTACVFASWCPAWQLGHNVNQLTRLAQAGQPALWCPTELPPTPAGWHITSDSLAAWLAAELGAQHLVLVKSVHAPAHSEPSQWQASGLVDAAFPGYAARFNGRITLTRYDQTL